MSHSVDQTAQTIVDLINSSPRSPTVEAIAAIIAKVTLPAPDASGVLSTKPETWGYQSVGAWQYLEAEWERYDFRRLLRQKRTPCTTLYTLRRGASLRAL